MARKKKKRLKMPKLSFVDQLIYGALFVLGFGLSFLIFFGGLYLRDRIAFADSQVIAASAHSSIYWLMVPFFTILLLTLITVADARSNRRPIFGLRNFKYGPPTYPKIYPLFMKNKPKV